MKFSEIPFHEDIKSRMLDMIDSGHLPHALLIEGEPGIGKYLFARALSQTIHCTGRRAGEEACGVCPSCIQHQNDNHIDTHNVFPVLKKAGRPTFSKDYAEEFKELMAESPFMDFDIWLDKLGNPNGQPQIYVEEVGSLVEKMNLTARQSRHKIVIVWLVERLREEAANKLLKLLEEPHADTLFIMSSDMPSAILPTIYSRTQRIKMRKYSDKEVAEILSEKFGIDGEAAEAIAPLAEGNVNSALKLVGNNKSSDAHLELFMRLMRDAWSRKVGELRKWSNEVAALGREGSARFYEYCSRMIRENYIMNLGEDALISLTPAEANFSAKFSPFINSGNVLGISAALDSARNDTLMNGSGKIIAFDLAVKMILLVKRGKESN